MFFFDTVRAKSNCNFQTKHEQRREIEEIWIFVHLTQFFLHELQITKKILNDVIFLSIEIFSDSLWLRMFSPVKFFFQF